MAITVEDMPNVVNCDPCEHLIERGEFSLPNTGVLGKMSMHDILWEDRKWIFY